MLFVLLVCLQPQETHTDLNSSGGTLPETNVAPEITGRKMDVPVEIVPRFRRHLNFRECMCSERECSYTVSIQAKAPGRDNTIQKS